MKQKTSILLSILFSFILLVSCSTSAKLTTSEQDGLTAKTAVVVKSVSHEYQWIRKNYPGSKAQGQMLVHEKRKPYDIITIKTASGKTMDIYFDISSFFGKGF
ncbi:hypothetical protein [Marinifilum sp.]|uniref:hypothetical protein n=1 Tax=Marinifilum sp. TaxID=2033137 RepID=UPI003BA9AFF6